MAEGAISFALEQLRDLLYEEGRLLSGVGGEVKELEKQLLKMKCLIKDADKRRHESDTFKNCIAEIRDLADRAEDAIELYAVRVSSKRRRGVKKVLRRYACILKECHSLHQLNSEISQIKSGLESVIKQMQDYGIIKKIVDGGESSDDKARETHPDFKDGDCFVGMEKELNQLVSLIEGKEHRIISVWGMGGLGKTTIARKLYNQIKNHPEAASCFDRFAWVCISQQFEINSVLKEALKQLDPQSSENASSLQQIPQVVPTKNDLMRRLHEIQRAHRCLIIIDDLWTLSHWESFNHAFIVEDLQNKVLVTTRKQNVAEMINGFSVKHGNLNMDEAWDLLKKKTFPDNNIPEHYSQEKLHEIGEKMLGKCGCLPLAINCVLGGVLRNKSIDDWESVHENMNEYMCKAEGDGEDDEYQIRGVLDLSYEELPYYLKPCFLYLGTLQEDESVKVLDLYRMWIAQGMISRETHGGKQGSLMDIAEIYLSELASRCIVEVEVEDRIPSEKYRSCKLHDVVREQCLLKGRKEGFGVTFLKLPGGDRGTSLLRYSVIHIAPGEMEEGVDELAKEDTNKLHGFLLGFDLTAVSLVRRAFAGSFREGISGLRHSVLTTVTLIFRRIVGTAVVAHAVHLSWSYLGQQIENPSLFTLEWTDKEGKTPLIAACTNPELYNVAKTLIELGANVNAYRPDPWLDCGWHLFVYSLTSCNKDELVFNKNTYVKRFLIFSSWHWILTVIDPHSETVYVLDSLNDKTHVEEWKSVVEMAMKVFNMSTNGKRTRKNMI